MITVDYNDREVSALLARLQRRLSNLTPAMRDIGEYLARSTKRRFVERKAPDGTPWKPNTETTLIEFLRRRGGGSVRREGEKSNNPYYRKDGLLNRRGANLISGKRPLIGESRRLSAEIYYRPTASMVRIGSPMEYAATQQFGAKRGAFGRTRRGAPIPWGDIPARPFLGVSVSDKARMLDILREHLERANA